MTKKLVNITIQAIMTEKDGIQYYEIGTINESKAGNPYITLTRSKTEEPLVVAMQDITEKAIAAKHYTAYQKTKLTIVHNTNKAHKAEEVKKEEIAENK